MTADEFRSLALALPEVVEGEHMGHADFRVGGKIFATLGAPDAAWGMVGLEPDQQEMLVRAASRAFRPANGAWGRQGSTLVFLAAATEASVQEALALAWRKRAPKSLARQHDIG